MTMTIAQSDTTAQLEDIAQRIAWNMTQIGMRLIEAGDLLLDARAICPHGQWSSFLASAQISESTARNLMNVAQRFKSATVTGYQAAALYALARPSVDEGAREIAETVIAGRDAQMTRREAQAIARAPEPVRQRYAAGALSLTQVEGLTAAMQTVTRPALRALVETQVSDPEVVPYLAQMPDDEITVIAATGYLQGTEVIPADRLTVRDIARHEEDRQREAVLQQQATIWRDVVVQRKATVVACDGSEITLQLSGLDCLAAGDTVRVTIERRAQN